VDTTGADEWEPLCGAFALQPATNTVISIPAMPAKGV
jgi:hypothetical protein